MSLREDLIRLAYAEPTMRPVLLPLLTAAKRKPKLKKPVGPPKPVLEAVEALAATSKDVQRDPGDLKQVTEDTLDQLHDAIAWKAEQLLKMAAKMAVTKAKPRFGAGEEEYQNGRDDEGTYESYSTGYTITWPQEVIFSHGITSKMNRITALILEDNHNGLDRRAVVDFFKKSVVVKYIEGNFESAIKESVKNGLQPEEEHALGDKALEAAYMRSEVDTHQTRYYTDDEGEPAEEHQNVVPEVRYTLHFGDVKIEVIKVEGIKAWFKFTYPISFGRSALPGDYAFDRL